MTNERANSDRPFGGGLRSTLYRQVGCLLLYGRRTPPPSISMCSGRVKIWLGDDADEAFRLANVLSAALSRETHASELDRLERFLVRIASPDEITGDGATEEMTGPAAREMRARMAMAQRGLDGDEYP